MKDASCPHCKADLSETDRGGAHCPYCGEMLPDALRLRPADESGRVAYGRAGGTALPLRPLPPKSRLEVIEAADRRLVVFVPAGGSRSKGLGCFALIWNGFMAFFSTLMIGAAVQEKQAGPALGMIGFLLLFWAVGLGVLYAWMRLRFTRWTILVEPGRAALQRIFFGRRSVQEAALAPDCRAELVEVYQQNNVPVHAVAIPGTDRTLKFGTALSDEEKSWLVDAVDACLDDRAAAGKAEDPEEDFDPRRCPECAAEWSRADDVTDRGVRHCPACGHEEPLETLAELRHAARSARRRERLERKSFPFDDLEPARLPDGSLVRIQADTPDRLAFDLPLVAASSTFRKVGIALLIATPVEWLVVAGVFVPLVAFGGGDATMVLVAVLFGLAGLLPGVLGLGVLRGRTAVDLRRDTVVFRWGCGPFGITRTAATAAIDAVSVVREPRDREAAARARRRGRSEAGITLGETNYRFCEVRAGGSTYLAAFAHEPGTTAEVAGLIRARARRYGARVDDGPRDDGPQEAGT